MVRVVCCSSSVRILNPLVNPSVSGCPPTPIRGGSSSSPTCPRRLRVKSGVSSSGSWSSNEPAPRAAESTCGVGYRVSERRWGRSGRCQVRAHWPTRRLPQSTCRCVALGESATALRSEGEVRPGQLQPPKQQHSARVVALYSEGAWLEEWKCPRRARARAGMGGGAGEAGQVTRPSAIRGCGTRLTPSLSASCRPARGFRAATVPVGRRAVSDGRATLRWRSHPRTIVLVEMCSPCRSAP